MCIRDRNIIQLIDEGNTIPFIARYRKEMTGSCDDQVLREFNDRLTYLRNLEQRKAEVAKSITEQEKMTEEIQKALDAAVTLTEVEDIYRPYKQKKKTRASVAIERGLQPLADFILAQDPNADVKAEAEKYIDEDKGVPTTDAALAGAKDIIAEIVSDDANVRKKLRNLFMRNGEIATKLVNTDKEDSKTYEMYADYSEPVAEIKRDVYKRQDLGHCLFSKTCRNCDKKNCYVLADEAGREFPLRRYENSVCRFELYNCAPMVCAKDVPSKLYDFTALPSAKKRAYFQFCGDENALKNALGKYTANPWRSGVR